MRPIKGDFHGHSFRSDGRRDPSAWRAITVSKAMISSR